MDPVMDTTDVAAALAAAAGPLSDGELEQVRAALTADDPAVPVTRFTILRLLDEVVASRGI